MKVHAGLWLTLIMAAPACHAVSLCTDANGVTTVQDTPCDVKAASVTNTPLTAEKLDDSNTVETIQRYMKAQSERDPAAATRFLARNYSATVTNKAGVQKEYDRVTVVTLMSSVMNAAKKFTATASCTITARSAATYGLDCQVKEDSVLPGGQRVSTASEEQFTLVLTGGQVLISREVSQDK